MVDIAEHTEFDPQKLRVPALALYSPRTIGGESSQLRIEYTQGLRGLGLMPDSKIVATARIPGMLGALANWRLELRDLDPVDREKINKILSDIEPATAKPLEVLKELYNASQSSGGHLWKELAISLAGAFAPASTLIEPVLPDLGNYLNDPLTHIVQYRTHKLVAKEPITIDALLDLERNQVEFRISRTENQSTIKERYSVPGPSNTDAASSSTDLHAKLLLIAARAFEEFHTTGLKGLHHHMTNLALAANRLAQSAGGVSQAPFTYFKACPWGTDVFLKLAPDYLTFRTATHAAHPVNLPKTSSSICQWKLLAPDVERRELAAETLQKLLPLIVSMQGEDAVCKIASELNRIADRQRFTGASVEAVLGEDTVKSVRALGGVKIRRVPPSERQRSENIARVLLGVDMFELSTAHLLETKKHPQVIHMIELGVVPNSSGATPQAAKQSPGLEILAWNRMSNCIKTYLPPQRVADAGGLSLIIGKLASSLHAQALSTPLWKSRVDFLAMLNQLSGLKPSSGLLQVGEGKFPSVNDTQTHKLIDTVVVPTINSFCEWTNNRGSESYFSSSDLRRITIFLGDTSNPYTLELEIRDSELSQVRVVHQSMRLMSPSRAHELRNSLTFNVRIPLGDKDQYRTGGPKVAKLTKLFAGFALKASRDPATRFNHSKLQSYLNHLSRPNLP